MKVKLIAILSLLFISTPAWASNSADNFWDFDNRQTWIGDSAEGNVEYCSEKSIRWTNPQFGFDINKDDVGDFMMPISCYQGEAAAGAKHNLKVRAAWKMYCSDNQRHYDCTSELFGSEVVEATSVSDDIGLGNDGGGNPYIHVTEVPRDLNNDGFPEFWYAVNRDDGRYGYDDSLEEDAALLEQYCGSRDVNSYTWDCTRKSIQTMLISNSDGTYNIVKLPWNAQNTQAILILPNTIGTFDVWGMIYGPHKVARLENNKFVDVTSEFQQDPLWVSVSEDGGPYAKAFELNGSYYIARADIPANFRPSWAKEVPNSGFMLWEYTPGEGFSVSDIYTPPQDQTFEYSLKQGDSIQEYFGAMVRDVPVFSPRWHFFDLEVLDDSGEPVLMVQSEAFTQAGGAFKNSHDPDIVYEYGDLYAAQNTGNKIFGGHSAIEGFFIRGGKLIPRDEDVIAGNAVDGIAFKRFLDINSDGFLDMIAASGGRVLPSVYVNDGVGTLDKVFLGDVFPDLFDEKYWQIEYANSYEWGASVYPFYQSNRLDLLFWTKGFTTSTPLYTPTGGDFKYSPGDISLVKSTQDVGSLRVFTPSEQHTLLEKCYSNGWFTRHGYQLACRMGLRFPDESEIDTDGDGVLDNLDAFRLDSSESLDTDGDKVGNNADTDDDNDGVSDAQESVDGTNPLLADSDVDGVSDSQEAIDGTNPLVGDTDGDGLLDGQEATHGTNPLSSDTDGDGYKDGDELSEGTDPLDANSAPRGGLNLMLIKAALDIKKAKEEAEE